MEQQLVKDVGLLTDLKNTLRDVLAWDQIRGVADPAGGGGGESGAGGVGQDGLASPSTPAGAVVKSVGSGSVSTVISTVRSKSDQQQVTSSS